MAEQDLWKIIEKSIVFQQHAQPWRGWLWSVPQLFDWDGPYDTKEEAFAVALRNVLADARRYRAAERAAEDDAQLLAAFTEIERRAGTLQEYKLPTRTHE